MLEMSRRTFLKSLLATVAVTALPALRMDNAILDAPVTEDEPLVWLQIDKNRIPVQAMAITIENNLRSAFAEPFIPLPSYIKTTINLKTHQPNALHQLYRRHGAFLFEATVPGSNFRISGNAIIDDMQIYIDHNKTYVDAHLWVVKELAFNIGDLRHSA